MAPSIVEINTNIAYLPLAKNWPPLKSKFTLSSVCRSCVTTDLADCYRGITLIYRNLSFQAPKFHHLLDEGILTTDLNDQLLGCISWVTGVTLVESSIYAECVHFQGAMGLSLICCIFTTCRKKVLISPYY